MGFTFFFFFLARNMQSIPSWLTSTCYVYLSSRS